MNRSWRERRESSSTTADGKIDSNAACINSLSLELNHGEREREGGRVGEMREEGGGGTGKYGKLWRKREQRRARRKEGGRKTG